MYTVCVYYNSICSVCQSAEKNCKYYFHRPFFKRRDISFICGLHYSNKETIRRGLRKARKYYGNHPEFQFYSLKLCRQIADVDHIWEDPDTFHRTTRDDIISDGYVVHSLEAAIWCLYTTNNYRDCVLEAVNLGEDTDTVAAIAGGLAGALYQNGLKGNE